MAIGDIRPQKIQATTKEDPQVAVAPISADVPDATLQQTPAATPACGSATLEGGSAAPTQSAAADSIVQFEDKTYNPYLSKKKMKLMMEVIHFYVTKMDGQLKTNLQCYNQELTKTLKMSGNI